MSVLFLVVGVDGVVGGEVEATALLAFKGEAGDEIAHVDHVAEFADVLRSLHALEEVLRFLVEHVETVPGTMQTEAENARAEQFGRQRVKDIISSSIEGVYSPQEMIETMTAAVRQFVGETEQSDDLTMLAIKYTKG